VYRSNILLVPRLNQLSIEDTPFSCPGEHASRAFRDLSEGYLAACLTASRFYWLGGSTSLCAEFARKTQIGKACDPGSGRLILAGKTNAP